MPLFKNFDRALGNQVLKVGNGFGSYVAIWRLWLNDSAVDLDRLATNLRTFIAKDGIVSIRLDELNHATTNRHSEEKTMRGGTEGSFDYLLCAEVMSGDQARDFEAYFTEVLPDLFPAIRHFDSSCQRMIYGEASHEGPSM